MKTIEFKTIQIGADTLSYKHQLISIMSAPLDLQSGAGIDEVRRSVRVLDALEKSNDDYIELEDADFVHLADKVQGTRYNLITKEILQFVDDVLASKIKE